MARAYHTGRSRCLSAKMQIKRMMFVAVVDSLPVFGRLFRAVSEWRSGRSLPCCRCQPWRSL